MEHTARKQFNRLVRRLLSRRTRLYHYTWGVLAINPENPDHYDANTTIWEEVAEPERALAEVERVYGEFGVTPRIRLTEYSAPDTLADFLRARGYCLASEMEEPARLMRWRHTEVAAPELPTGITARRATTDDVPAIMRIQFEEAGLMGAWAEWYLTAALADSETTYFLAEVDGVPAATLALGQTARLGLIDDVATLPEFRGRGLAAILLRHAQQAAATDLMLEVIADNAQRLYERAGFAVVAHLRESTWKPC